MGDVRGIGGGARPVVGVTSVFGVSAGCFCTLSDNSSSDSEPTLGDMTGADAGTDGRAGTMSALCFSITMGGVSHSLLEQEGEQACLPGPGAVRRAIFGQLCLP